MMRITGYILLILGFLWLAIWCELTPGALMSGIVEKNFKKYPDNGKFSGAQVQDAIKSVVLEYMDKAPGILLPTTLMLAGGILIDVASRRRAKHVVVKDEAGKIPD